METVPSFLCNSFKLLFHLPLFLRCSFLTWGFFFFLFSFPDVLSQMETTPTLTPSNELVSSTPTTVAGSGIAGGDQLTNLDLSSLFSSVPGGTAPTTGIGVGIPVGGATSNGPFTMDLSLVSSGILTIDPSSVGTTLVTSTNTTMAKAVDPLILAANADMTPHHNLEGTASDVLRPQGTLNLDDVQTVTPEALGTLTALTMQGAGATVDPTLQHPLSSSSSLSVEPTASLAVAPVAELLGSPSKVEVGGQGGAGTLLGCVEVLGPQEGGKVLTQFVFPGHSSSFSPQKDSELSSVSPSSFLVSIDTHRFNKPIETQLIQKIHLRLSGIQAFLFISNGNRLGKDPAHLSVTKPKKTHSSMTYKGSLIMNCQSPFFHLEMEKDIAIVSDVFFLSLLFFSLRIFA